MSTTKEKVGHLELSLWSGHMPGHCSWHGLPQGCEAEDRACLPVNPQGLSGGWHKEKALKLVLHTGLNERAACWLVDW